MQLDCNKRITPYIRHPFEPSLNVIALRQNRQARRRRQLFVHDTLLRYTVSVCRPSLQPHLLQCSSRMVARNRLRISHHFILGGRPLRAIHILQNRSNWIVGLMGGSGRLDFVRVVYPFPFRRMGKILRCNRPDWLAPLQHEVLPVHR